MNRCALYSLGVLLSFDALSLDLGVRDGETATHPTIKIVILV